MDNPHLSVALHVSGDDGHEPKVAVYWSPSQGAWAVSLDLGNLQVYGDPEHLAAYLRDAADAVARAAEAKLAEAPPVDLRTRGDDPVYGPVDGGDA